MVSPASLSVNSGSGVRWASTCLQTTLEAFGNKPTTIKRLRAGTTNSSDLDGVLERIYIDRRFRNDTERLEKLFEMYTKIAAAPASLMRRMRLCEEQGTGIDKVFVSVESHKLPPPDFRAEGDAVRVTLFAPRRFAEMTPDERIRACFQHAALKYVNGERMKNWTLCERFGINPRNASLASVVIRRSLEAGLIKPADSAHPRAGYVPFWA